MSFYIPAGYDDLLRAIDEAGNEVPCQADPSAFFPETGNSHYVAKELCRLCPVKLECLEYALGANETYGVWGGLGPDERERLNNAGR